MVSHLEGNGGSRERDVGGPSSQMVSSCSWWLSFSSGSCESSQFVSCLVAGELATRWWRPGIRSSTSSAKVSDTRVNNSSRNFNVVAPGSGGCGLLKAYLYWHVV